MSFYGFPASSWCKPMAKGWDLAKGWGLESLVYYCRQSSGRDAPYVASCYVACISIVSDIAIG